MKRILLTLLLLPSLAWGQNIGPGPQANPLSLNGPKQAGRFYGPMAVIAPNAAAVAAANRVQALPVFIQNPSLLKTLSFNITTGNASAWNARMCVYADNGSGLPGALVVDGGTLAVGSGSVTGVQTTTLAGGGTMLGGPAWYWVTFNADNAGESVSTGGNATSGPLSSSTLLGWASVANITATTATGVYVASTFGACPNPFGTPTFGDGQAFVYVVMGY